MRRLASRSLALAVLFGAMLHAQTPRPFKVVRLDPALDAIVSTDAKIEILGEHFGLTEGPVWIQEPAGGYLLFSDCAANVIYKWMAGKPLSVFLEKSGYTGTDTLNVGHWITSPEGKHLGTLQLPQITGEPRPRICATNVAFGDADNKGLYITACTHLFKVRLKASAR